MKKKVGSSRNREGGLGTRTLETRGGFVVLLGEGARSQHTQCGRVG